MGNSEMPEMELPQKFRSERKSFMHATANNVWVTRAVLQEIQSSREQYISFSKEIMLLTN